MCLLRWIDQDSIDAGAVASGRLAHIVPINPDGSPQVSCIYVGWDGDEIIAGHLQNHKKLKNIRRDERVAISIECDLDVPRSALIS